MKSTFADDEFHVLLQLIEAGVARAAAGLRELIGAEVALCVRNVQVAPGRGAASVPDAPSTGRSAAVYEEFEGDFGGRTVLLFSESEGLELIRAVMGRRPPIEDIIDLEQEALAECGGLILNSCLASIGSLSGRTFRTSLPEVLPEAGLEVLSAGSETTEESMLIAFEIRYEIETRRSSGGILLAAVVTDASVFRKLLGERR